MDEELIAIPISEYKDLLQCKQRLEDMIQERINTLDNEIAYKWYRMQLEDCWPKS